MNDDLKLDDKLRAALREEDAELLERLDKDPGIADYLRAGFRGRTAWWVVLVSVVQVVIFGMALWTGSKFVFAETVDDRVHWGVWLLLTALGVSMLKMMVWSHLERNMIRREVKRLELQVATLTLRVQGQQ